MNSTIITLVIAVAIVGAIIFVAILLTGKKPYTFNKLSYQSDLLMIKNGLIKSNPATYDLSLVEADKLLDKALSEMGVPGATMGERLKHSGNKFSALNSVWYVHKLRNQIAHEHGFHIEYKQAAHSLAVYEQALKDLGAI